MSYYGSWKIDDVLTFVCNTHDPDTGVATDADAVPAYRVHEDETGAAILNDNMAKLDDANTVGYYSEQLTLSTANGFEKGKSYNIYISATVDGDEGTMSHNFQMEAEVDANTVSATNVSANVVQVAGVTQRGTDLAELAQFLIANTATLTDIIADDSILAKLLATDGDISGFAEATDSLQSIRDRGDSAWPTATSVTVSDKTGFSLSSAGIKAIWDQATSALTTVGSIGKLIVDNLNATISSRSSHAAAAIWSVAVRVLTAGTNLNDFDPANDTVANVTAVGTTTTNSDMVSEAPTAAQNRDAILDDATRFSGADIASILDDTGSAGVVVAGASKTGYQLSNTGIDNLFTRALTEAYAADGAAPTVAQALLAIQQFLQERVVASTTVTVKKVDGSATAMTFTINDDTSPTSITRSG